MIRGFILIILLSAYFPSLSGAAQGSTERADILFAFDQSVSPEEEFIVREGTRFAQDYLIATFGQDVQQPVTINVTSEAHGPAEHASFERGVEAHYNMWDLRGFSYLQHIRFMVHGYVHLWQYDHIGSTAILSGLGPSWIVEGSADYLGLHALIEVDLISEMEAHEFMAVAARGIFDGRQDMVLPPLDRFEESSALYQPDTGCCSYGLSALAVEMLVKGSGIQAIGEYFASLHDKGWQLAFKEAFGFEVEEFYRSFEAQRTTLLSLTGIDITQLIRTPNFNDAPAPVSLGSAPASVKPGEQALLFAWSGDGSSCVMTVMGEDGAQLAALPTYADA